MKRVDDPEREVRIRNEAVVDAYGEEERAMGWYYYREGEIEFPFAGRCIKKVSTSPLKPRQTVEVTGMADEGVCEHDMIVTVVIDGDEIDVPLVQIGPCDATEDTNKAVGDWHYWKARGYEF